MGNDLLASKVVAKRDQPRVNAIQSLATAVPGFVGVTERGPIGEETLLTSWDDYLSVFGGHTADSELPNAVHGFFYNGGGQCRVARTLHYTDPDNPASHIGVKGTLDLDTAAGPATFGTVTSTISAPFILASGDTLDVTTEGGGPTTATFTGTAATVESGAENYDLSGDPSLVVEIEGVEQTIAFVSATDFAVATAATAEEVAVAINSRISGAKAYPSSTNTKVTIESDLKGTDSEVQVTGGSANTALAFPTTLQTGGGNVADITNVTAAEVKTIVELAVSGVTVSGSTFITIATTTVGSGGWVRVEAASTADTKMGLDNLQHFGTDSSSAPTITVDGKTEGSYTGRVTVRVADATSGVAAEFNFQVLLDGVVVGSFPNLSMTDTDDRYFETIVNDERDGSNLITLTDLALGQRPGNGTFGPLTGGDDGLTGLVDADFIGSSAGKTGLYALDTADDITLLSVPGRATSAVVNAMITYAEVWRSGRMFVVVETPEDSTAQEAVDYVDTGAAILETSEYGAIYWPWVKILNPSQRVYGDVDDIVTTPVGHILGAYARTDADLDNGVYQAAANIELGILRGVTGFEHDESIDENKRDFVYPKRINPLTTFKGAPKFIDGSRTLKASGDFPSIGESRGAIHIAASLQRGLQFARHRNNTPQLRARVNRTVRLFLIGEMNKGAFASTDPETAFFVDTSEQVNPPSEQAAGRLWVRVGLAFAKPAEYVIILIGADTRALDEELAS